MIEKKVKQLKRKITKKMMLLSIIYATSWTMFMLSPHNLFVTI